MPKAYRETDSEGNQKTSFLCTSGSGVSGQLYVGGICSREKGNPVIADDHGTVQATVVHV